MRSLSISRLTIVTLACLAAPLLSAQAESSGATKSTTAEPAASADLADAGRIDALARRIAGEGGAIVRAQRLVTWTNQNLEWTATDYVQRSAEEIIARRHGNCAELSSVLERLLRPAGIEHRWVAEINLQPPSATRAQDADALIAKRGAAASVFGRAHNDHRWLEVRDDVTGDWQPADPSLGVIGIERWLMTRMALTDRERPAVAAAAAILDEMIAPVAVLLPGSRDRPALDRSGHYLIEGFGAMQGGRVRTLPSWGEWERAVRAGATGGNGVRGPDESARPLRNPRAARRHVPAVARRGAAAAVAAAGRSNDRSA